MRADDPLTVEAAFWQRDDVTRAVSQRDIGALFLLLRRHVGASQHRIGAAVDLQQGTVSAIMKGERAVTSIEVLERIAGGLHMPDDARMRLGLAPQDTEGMRRRTALGLGLAAALTPALLAEVLRESAAEAMEFIRERAASSVGTGTLDHLTAVIAELDRAYPWRPTTELFPLARAYRQRVQQLLGGRCTVREARELSVHGAYLSHILSDLAHDLSSTLAARAYAVDSYQLSEQAGHNELCAWAADSLAATLRWTDRPAESITAALKGLRRAPRRHPLAARLHARAAQGYAQQGNREACADRLAKARTACDRLPAEMASRFGRDTEERNSAIINAYTVECHARLGNWTETAQHAGIALGVIRWSRGRATGVRLDLAIALAHLGSPDDAIEHGNQALSSGLVRLGSILPRVRELDAVLTSRYPKEPDAQDFHDRYRQLADHTVAD